MTDVRPTSRRRAVAAWTVIGLVVVLVGILGSVISGAGQRAQRDALDPESAAPQGGRALARILAERGVDVVVARDRATASRALSEGSATLAIADARYLADETLTTLADAAPSVVLIDPSSRDLRLLLSGSRSTGVAPGGSVEPRCEDEAASRAGTIEPGDVFSAGGGVDGCYPVDGDAFALLTTGDVTAVDGRALLSNEHLATSGNAALAVNLLGATPRLVWFVPGIADADAGASGASLGELTPGWVTPAILLLLGAALAAAVWRGRRFGPLVAERLPVTVRASETTEGRARLYGRSRDAVHSADQLRIGALGRLARTLALGPAASAPEIADAAADRLGADRSRLRGILFDDLPADDRQLLALSDSLRDLETAVQAAVRPERNRP
ncbi:putative membrane protein [Microbacterium lemovicicum]|uniref:Putative membrane protein n=1 Tax=Microbacterium lemovicicum TaxID=1072463 RepID=A0A3S9W835_9MICO|nr:DUF4350 domain-containing protein [Microbacterium lemovicicum]AZS36179.1 putative membrane protein [Microbacterium lemovicicum]